MKTIGLRCKSGFAVVIVVEGTLTDWEITGRMQVALTAGQGKYSRFPYHPLIELDAQVAASVSENAVATVRREARRQLDGLLLSLQEVHGAGIVAGSLTDPERITNSHIRVHAREGRLFREVIAEALDRAGVPRQILSDRDGYRNVAARLAMTESQFKDQLHRRGRAVVKPWRADEKLAAVGAIAALTG